MSFLKTNLIYLFLFGFIACKGVGGNDVDKTSVKVDSEHFIELNHAERFRIKTGNGYTRITVLSPWQGANDIYLDYYLVERGNTPPPGIPSMQIIYVPVENIVCLSTTHIGFIDILGKTGKISGIAGGRFISNSNVLERLEKGLIKDIGFDQNLNYELLVQLNPDVVMAYGIGPETTGYLNKLKDLGLRVIFNAEYLETTPLGKAEWLIFTGYLFQKEQLAKELFREIEKEYNSLIQIASKASYNPEILINIPWKGTWYMPGGNSSLARMIKDAGGNYLWSDSEANTSFPVDIESVFRRAKNANIWINTGNALTTNDILSEDSRLKFIKPLINKRVYNNNARLGPTGGNDYWEKGIIEPHVILKDLIHIFHPNLLPEHQLVYYRKLN